jgi:hypothetical protein
VVSEYGHCAGYSFTQEFVFSWPRAAIKKIQSFDFPCRNELFPSLSPLRQAVFGRKMGVKKNVMDGVLQD